MSKHTNLFTFLKRKEPEPATTTTNEEVMPESSTPVIEQNIFETHRTETDETKDLLLSLERYPGLRVPMWDYRYEKRDQTRRAYLKLKPYQPILKSFLFSGPDSHHRRFQASWYKRFPDWLEYSTSKNVAFCLLCYLFADKPNRNTKTFTLVGFNNWKKVNDGDNCPFITHVGGGPCSTHNNSVRAKIDLLNDRGHIRHALISRREEQIKRNRVRLMTSINVVRLLTLQACPLKGHNESENSENRGNFLEFHKAFARYNDKVSKAIENTDYNAKYVAPSI
ncbi:uncharacterized protein LOC141594858 [Silene latifolia]|uniref:uncharacterized protein LOC141594858 n=1 Tax=Silene latifolia TaxID=37657 RepID=UPI003D784E06